MKHICFFNSITFWGGGEKLHLENAISFRDRSYQVTVASNKNSLLYNKASSAGFATFPVSVHNLSFLNPIKILRLVRFYRKQQIDTVVFSASQDLKLGSIAAKIAGVKRIVYLRGLSLPVKATLTNILIFRSILTHIVLNSQDTKKNTLKHLKKYVDESRVHVIYHGIELNIDSTQNVNKLKLIEEKGRGIILGNAGRLTAQKGQEHLIRIASLLKKHGIKFTLFIAGSGELEQKLNSLIEEYDVRKEVILTGFVNDMDGFMNAIDIFLFTSIWEGFGYVIVEAMVKSKPVVAFDITSNPEIIAADKTGFLVAYPDLEQFAERTIQLINDPSLRKSMGAAGKQSVFDRFNLNDRISEFEQCLISPAPGK
jgi:glycosyltransferase involved in cell wall biosynthesis